MKAATHIRYGTPGAVLEIDELEIPAVGDDEVLVRVHAASVNPADWYGVTGRPMLARVIGGLRRPKDRRVGIDFAGTVERVGKHVTDLAPGHEVFGARHGALAEYVCVGDTVVAKPASVTMAEAGGTACAALTALQGLRDKGGLQPGHTVLINGASGGVGTFAVQIAKALGADVTAVCSTPNVEAARSLGADRVVDYTREDFTRGDARYDLIFDIAGSRRWSQYRRVLKPDATLVIVGAPKGGPMLGPLRRIVRLKLASIPGSRHTTFFMTKATKDDLNVLRDLLERGALKPMIDRTYALADVGAAFEYLGEGHAQGKVVVTV